MRMWWLVVLDFYMNSSFFSSFYAALLIGDHDDVFSIYAVATAAAVAVVKGHERTQTIRENGAADATLDDGDSCKHASLTCYKIEGIAFFS